MTTKVGSVAQRVQKKLAGKMPHRNMLKVLLPEGTLDAFDHLHSVLVQYYTDKEAEKVISYIMKVVAKLGIMLQDAGVVERHLPQLMEMQESLKALFRTAQSFHQLHFSYSRGHLCERLGAAEGALQRVVQRLLSAKSGARVQFVFERLRNTRMLDELFRTGGRHEADREKLIDAVDLIVP